MNAKINDIIITQSVHLSAENQVKIKLVNSFRSFVRVACMVDFRITAKKRVYKVVGETNS